LVGGRFFFTVNLDDSYPFVIKYLGALSWFLALTFYIDNENRIYEILWMLVLLSIPLSALSLIQQYDPSVLRYHLSHSSTSIFIQMNLFSCYLVFIAPIAILLFFRSVNNLQKIISSSAFLLLGPALGFSGSPGGQFTVVIELAAICFFCWHFSDKIRFKTLVFGIVFSFLFYVVLVFVLQPKDMIQSSIQTADSVSLMRRAWVWNHILERFEFWQAAWGIFKDHWIVGSGPWTFNLLYPQYLTGSEAVHPHAINAHSLFIQTASDLGFIGLTLLICFVVLFFATVFPILKTGLQGPRFLILCLSISIVGFLIQGLIEYLLPVSLFLHYLVLWVAAMAFLAKRNEANKKFHVLHFTGVVSAVIGVFALGWFYVYDDLINTKIYKSKNEKEFFKNISKAKKLCSRCDRPHVLTAGWLIENYRKNQNPEILSRAEEALKEATRLGHLGFEMDFFRAQIEDLQGKNEKANFYRKRAKEKSRLGNPNIFNDFNRMENEPL
jgi:hypothetical protein